jgi:glycosyltransferase involved in cell wall biosynthesis
LSIVRHIPVTVIILTHNEAVNIAACVSSVSAFAEVVAVDSGSTDGTLAILRSRFPHVRVLEHPFENFGQQRNWALDMSTRLTNGFYFSTQTSDARPSAQRPLSGGR